MPLRDQSYVAASSLRTKERSPKLPRGREIQFTLVDLAFEVRKPALIRLDRWNDSSFVADSIRVSYDADGGQIDEATALVSIGNYIYLPVPGRYKVHNVSAAGAWTGGTINLTGCIWEGIDELHALMFLTTIFPAYTRPTRNVVLGAGANASLMNDPVGGRVYLWRLHSAIITNTGAGDLLITAGVAGAAGFGHALAVGATFIFGPGQLTGITLEAFSVAGTTVAVTLSYR
jgi:hypothetical protein